MAAATTAQQVADAVRPGVESTGLFLEDVKVAPAGAKTVVRIVVDLSEDETGSVGLDQVAEVARVISDVLDERQTMRGAYTLEVTSPGTSRPLTELRHFKRARTRLVEVHLVDGSSFTARLTALDGTDLVFEDGERRVPLVDVRSGQVEVELRRAEKLDESSFTDFEGSDSSDQTDGEV
ncbi:ribosome maturation factor RimP [Sanguibacter antarcticus]|uniref:Ribosome maturation factor RimP n=1 Tax=Sanguibacter antarcticus TaxID=372484 RepID=A0A2A9E3W9_9MICO|nr:ribosome assembly cofactor RimP [Sanguibacter antarcticus]PFG33534.1 ribosome maturation factor RimP [Sanguibacter antarcticus]